MDKKIRLAKNMGSQVVQLPCDLVFKILLLLPGQEVVRLRSVCKEWLNIIDSSTFVDAHIRQCETGLVFLRTTSPKRFTFSIEERALIEEIEQFSIFQGPLISKHISYINFLELQNGNGMISESNISGLGNILATCNGLILVTIPKNQGLVVINPVTHKLIRLPLGTIVASEDEAYGFIFINYTSEYKVIHLFQDKAEHVGCEILSLTTKSWHAVNGPGSGQLNKFTHRPVSAAGALYWLPPRHVSVNLVYLSISDEKFRTRALPISSAEHDRIVEFCGSLSFVTHVTLHQMQVWILSGQPHEEKWTMQYRITIHHSRIIYWVPIVTSRNGKELIFAAQDGSLFAYDFEVGSMKIIEMETDLPQIGSYLPHLNTLASW